MDHAQSSSASVPAEIFLCSTYKPHFFLDFFQTFRMACYGRDMATLYYALWSQKHQEFLLLLVFKLQGTVSFRFILYFGA